jgi:hypothetical protein
MTGGVLLGNLRDPRSTHFRYHDAQYDGPYEMWVYLGNLCSKVELMFQALERVRLLL